MHTNPRPIKSLNVRAGDPRAARSQVDRQIPKPRQKRAATYQCLIVSANAQRRALLTQAAADAGWITAECADAASALALLGRAFVQLAVVDVEGVDLNAPQQAALRTVVERIAAQSGLLLVVCGNVDRMDEEIWVRQLGAWMYLPGVVESSNVALLCGEARHIAERMGWAAGSERTSGAPRHRGKP